MAKASRLNSSTIQDDLAALDAIAEMTDFKPSNADYKATALDGLKQDMLAKQSADQAAVRAAATARDEANDAERAYHDAIIGAKTAVKAQYGKDSNEVQAVGLKKSSEIARGRRKTTTAKNG